MKLSYKYKNWKLKIDLKNKVIDFDNNEYGREYDLPTNEVRDIEFENEYVTIKFIDLTLYVIKFESDEDLVIDKHLGDKVYPIGCWNIYD